MKERIIKYDNREIKTKFNGYSKTTQIIYKSKKITNLMNYLLIILFLQLKYIHSENEITITIKGNGQQKILSTDTSCGNSAEFNSLPDQILINGILQDNTDKYVYNLINQINNITIKWNSPLTNCNVMFSSLENIINIDLSKFDSSRVTDIRCMFRSCTSLESINLSNFNTSLVTNMIGVFECCHSLKSLDLKSFDTSKVTTMWCMFYYCKSLKSLDLSNFNTSTVNDMHVMFESCISLTKLNIRNFNINQDVYFSQMFHGVNTSLIYCINDESELVIKSEISNYKKNCSEFCPKNYSKLIYGNNMCIDDCKHDIIYKFEYNDKCYESCPNGTHNSAYDNYLCEKNLICDKYYNYNYTGCLDNIPEGYYLNNSNLKTIDKCDIKCGNCSYESMQYNLCISCNIKNNYYPKFNGSLNNNTFIDCYNYLEGYYLYNNSYYQCYETCKNCYSQGNQENHNCIDCISNFTFINNNENENNKNCYIKCPYYYYFDLNQKYICTLDNKCPEEYNKLIINKKECVNNCSKELFYKYEYNNTCLLSCPNKTHNLSYNNYLCEDDLICDKYYNYNYTSCIEDIPSGFYLNNSYLKTIDKCDIKCGNCSYESVQYNLCISCNINNNYYPIFNDSLNNNSFINCYNKTQLTEDYILDNNIFKKCYESCQICSEIGDEKNHKCIKCKDNFIFKEDFENDKNCYEICKYFYYFDSSNQYHCTLNNECPKEHNKIIKNKNKCVDKCSNDNQYRYEFINNENLYECIEKCPEGTKISEDNEFLCKLDCPEDLPYEDTKINKCVEKCNTNDYVKKTCIENNLNAIKNDKSTKDNKLTNLQEDLLSGSMNDAIQNLTQGEKKDIIIEEEGTTIQLTTTDNQNNNENNNNRSTIRLGECENKLKEHYNINKEDCLLILKIDVFEEGLLIPKIEYEVYNPNNMEKLNLSICADTKVDLAIPVSINEDDLYKHDSNSDYYNDICFTYTSEKGTDVSLDDRKKEFVDNNMTLCEENCDFNGYDPDTKKALCSCQIKVKLPLISEISIDREQLYKNFMNIKNILNFNIMKCYKVLFTKEGIKNNIGGYIIIPIIFIHIICVIFFYVKGFNNLKQIIKKIINSRMNKKDDKNRNKETEKDENKKNKEKNNHNEKTEKEKDNEKDKKDNKKEKNENVEKNKNKEKKYEDKNKEKQKIKDETKEKEAKKEDRKEKDNDENDNNSELETNQDYKEKNQSRKGKEKKEKEEQNKNRDINKKDKGKNKENEKMERDKEYERDNKKEYYKKKEKYKNDKENIEQYKSKYKKDNKKNIQKNKNEKEIKQDFIITNLDDTKIPDVSENIIDRKKFISPLFEQNKEINLGNNINNNNSNNFSSQKIETNPIQNNFQNKRNPRMFRMMEIPGISQNFSENISVPPIKKRHYQKKRIHFINTNGEENMKSSLKIINVKNQNLLDSSDRNKQLNDLKLDNDMQNINQNRKLVLTDYELNILLYKDALKIDKRTYIQYYMSLIKTNHVIIFTFFNYKDYNSLVIKISFFLFYFTLYYTTNALFFNDSTMHRINEDGGSFNLGYQIPQIIYSSLISSVINAVFKIISLTEKNIIEIKQEISIKHLIKKAENIEKWIFMKSIFYFVSSSISLLFFWYYISCFCAIYKNTQLHLVKDTLFSYGLSMIYPFGIYLLPGIFRIPSLRSPKKNRETMYKFSKMLQLI